MRAHAILWITVVYLSVCCHADAKTRRRQIWNASEEDETSQTLPSFRDTPDRVTVKQGQMAKLECSVDSLGTKKVVWRRKSDPNPLTIGPNPFVVNDRFSVEHVPLEPDWHLIIKQVRIDDEGFYECQISSMDRELRKYVYLSVKPAKRKQKTTPETEMTSTTSPEINITGKTYVEKNQKIRLYCNATGAGQSLDSLDWFLNGQKLTTDVEKKIFIQMQVSLMDKTISSILEVEEADMEDAGVYVCRTSDMQVASTRVDVLNADTNNVKRGTEKDTTSPKTDSSMARLDSPSQQDSHSVAVTPSPTFSTLTLIVWLTVTCSLAGCLLVLPT